MKISQLITTGFRNLKDGEFLPCDGVNVIYGDNGQGKTNLTEAIWMFTGGKSFRGAREQELVSFGKNEAKLWLQFESGGREQTAELSLGEKKNALLNGVTLPAARALTGEFNAAVFSPDHLALVKAGPGERRRFLDSAICQIRPKYGGKLSEYQQILKQRNALLKDIPQHRELEDTLVVWDEKLAVHGAFIANTRRRYIEKLSVMAEAFYGGIALERERLSVSYECSFGECGDKSIQHTEYMSALEGARAEDMRYGHSTVGVHRDDLIIKIDGREARIFGSQGQQRSSVLAMKLAEMSILEENIGEKPVCILDDVLSELDPGRQDYVLNHISGGQVFITCCDLDAVRRLSGGKAFEIKAGGIANVSSFGAGDSGQKQ